ncbi:3129_t:CDS:2, partial [Funneliformis caledonium]
MPVCRSVIDYLVGFVLALEKKRFRTCWQAYHKLRYISMQIICIITDYHAGFVLAVEKVLYLLNDKSSNQINHFWDLQVKRHNVKMEIKLLEAKNKLLMKEQ